MRNRTTRVWAMIDADFHQDEDLELIAGEHGPKALAYWAILICESKKVHRGKKDGWAGPFTLTQFAALCYDEKTTKKALQKMLQLFVDRGLLELKGELTGRWRSRPTNFAALQNKGRNAVDQANSRGNMQGNDDERQVPVRRESDDSQTVVSDPHGRAGLDVDVDVYQSSKLDKSRHDADRASWLNSDVTYTPQPTDPMIAFIDQMRSILMDAYQESSAGQLAEAVYRMSAKRGPMTTTYPDDQWMRAAQELVKAIKDGRIENPSKGAAWIRAAVPTAVGELDTVDGVGEPAEDPDVVRVREMAARYNTEGAA